MSLELEILDQLLAGDMAMSVLARVTDSAERFQRAVKAEMADGLVALLDADGRELTVWEWDRFCRDHTDDWAPAAARLTARITAKGIARIA